MSTTPIAQLSDQFINHGRYLRGWSPKTIRTYQQSLTALQVETVDQLSRATLQALVVAMRERGLSAGGINVRLRTINSFLTWLREDGYISEPLRVRLLPKPPAVLVTFSDTDVRRILAVRPTVASMVRAWTLFVVLVDTGLRIEEALTLEQQRVDLDRLALTVLGKGSRERIVPISPECRKALFRMMSKEPGQYVFSAGEDADGRLTYRNAYRDLKKLCRQAGVVGSHVRPHNIRHYFAVTYLRNGGDLYRLSRILGHTSITTTQTYLRSMRIDHVQEGHARYSPLGRLA